MRLRNTAKRCLPPIVVDAIRWVKNAKHSEHSEQSDKILPWSAGYYTYKTSLIAGSLADEALLRRFRFGESLPSVYGVGIDERCVEYPWVFAHINVTAGVLLDAGSALNHDFILDHPILRNKTLHILTLAPEWRCFWQKGISYLFCDLRDIPIGNEYYDTVACISTLEHVRCDNTLYTQNDAHQEDHRHDFVLAMQELARVVKPGGHLFLTVPFGVYRHFGSFQQFDSMLLPRAIAAFGEAAQVAVAFYRYSKEGWNVANQADCEKCEYWRWIGQPRATWPDPLPVEPDLATGARAVACVKFIK